jgi:putative phosphoesterase
MSTKIGLISDPHSTTAPLKEALSIFEREHVDTIICAGDIAGYGEDQLEQTVELLLENNCLMIAGNHDCWPLDENDNTKYDKKIEKFFKDLPTKLELTIAGKKIYVAHAHPPDSLHGGIKLLDPDGHVYPDRKEYWAQELKNLKHDILIVGHTHQIFNEQVGDVLVINPGSTTFNHNCSILSIPEMTVHNFALSNKTPLKVWNWGMFYKGL